MERGIFKSSVEQQKRMIDCELLYNEVHTNIEHFEPYGYTSCPLQGAELLAVPFDNDYSHIVVTCVTDKRYRPKINQGEVCVFDNQQRQVYLAQNGIRIEGVQSDITINTQANINVNANANIVIKAGASVNITCESASIKASQVTIDSPNTSCTGNLTVSGNLTASNGSCSMSGGSITTSGTITAKGDIKAGSISLANHTHTAQGENAETTKPH